MSQEPLYRRVPQQGKHPANSKRIPGAISGAALDDETNKPSGSSDFIPVGLTEDEYIRQQKKAVFWGELLQMGMDYASAKVLKWWNYTALPKIHYVIIPKGKKKVKEIYKRFVRREDSINVSEHGCVKEADHDSNNAFGKGIPTVTLSEDLSRAYNQYTTNMNSEEAQRELFEAFVFHYLSMKKIQKLSHARIIDSTGTIVEGAAIIQMLSDPAIVASINQLLESHQDLRNNWQAEALADALGRSLIQENCYIPIDRNELFPELVLHEKGEYYGE